MKFSIVTAVLNRENSIAETLISTKNQIYPNFEHIVIDGCSSDNTLKIINSYSYDKLILTSEKDNGLYNAINKGILKSSGDIIGLIHSDDVFFSNEVLSEVAFEFENSNIDMVYGDVVFKSNSGRQNIIRRYRSGNISKKNLSFGCMPAHTAIFFRKIIFEKYGLYNENYKIAADFEFLARIFSSGYINYKYINKNFVVMSIGGVSTSGFKNTILLNKEVLNALKFYNYNSNIFKIISKYPKKILEFIY